MKSPGIALLDKVSESVKSKITSQTDLLLRFCDNTIIGITGTKGKSTVSSLTCHLLKKCGKDAVLVGNIGIPPLERMGEFRDGTVIVCEMSCHQLEYVQASPQVAVLLNVFEAIVQGIFFSISSVERPSLPSPRISTRFPAKKSESLLSIKSVLSGLRKNS